jgi:hypothetical protein
MVPSAYYCVCLSSSDSFWNEMIQTPHQSLSANKWALLYENKLPAECGLGYSRRVAPWRLRRSGRQRSARGWGPVKVNTSWSLCTPCRRVLGVDLYLHTFLNSAVGEGEWSTSRPGCFTHTKRANVTHWTGGWVGPRVGLDALEKTRNLLSPRKSNHDSSVV